MGVIILAALFVFDPIVGLGCMLGGLTATLVELVLGLHPWGDLTNGLPCFNAVLVGTVIPILYPAVYNTDRTLAMWFAIVGGSIVRSELLSLSAKREFAFGKLNDLLLNLIFLVFSFLEPSATS